MNSATPFFQESDPWSRHRPKGFGLGQVPLPRCGWEHAPSKHAGDRQDSIYGSGVRHCKNKTNDPSSIPLILGSLQQQYAFLLKRKGPGAIPGGSTI